MHLFVLLEVGELPDEQFELSQSQQAPSIDCVPCLSLRGVVLEQILGGLFVLEVEAAEEDHVMSHQEHLAGSSDSASCETGDLVGKTLLHILGSFFGENGGCCMLGHGLKVRGIQVVPSNLREVGP